MDQKLTNLFESGSFPSSSPTYPIETADPTAELPRVPPKLLDLLIILAGPTPDPLAPPPKTGGAGYNSQGVTSSISLALIDPIPSPLAIVPAAPEPAELVVATVENDPRARRGPFICTGVADEKSCRSGMSSSCSSSASASTAECTKLV